MEPPEQEFPTEFRAFLYSCIDSVEQVEILAVVSQSNHPWNARAVGARVGVPDTVARHHLETLSARGLLQIKIANEVTYSYGPKSADLRRYGDQLAEYYATSRTALLRFIATSPPRVKRFADAFKLRDPD
jgi:predicted ArsR family transcriptional regulator